MFGDGSGVTVLAGGTILMPEVTYGRYPKGGRTLMLHRAGMDTVTDDGTVTFGAMATLDAVVASGVQPLADAAAAVADPEIRAQATIGGNLAAPPGRFVSARGPAGAVAGHGRASALGRARRASAPSRWRITWRTAATG